MSSFRPRLQKSTPQPYADGWQQAASAAVPRHQSTSLARPIRGQVGGNLKTLAIVLSVVFVTNLITHLIFNPAATAPLLSADRPRPDVPIIEAPGESLYLMEKANMFVADPNAFENKVREIAAMLSVPPEWLMAVMYSESKFDAAVKNFKGSGATGLIQFMPAAASEMKVTLERLSHMDHLHQLEYVYLYLQKVRERYGEFNSLTDLYLGILYPKAMGQDFCYTLYAHPSKAFRQNSGLDENRDNHVTVSDIDRRMKRLYPKAYMAEKGLAQAVVK